MKLKVYRVLFFASLLGVVLASIRHLSSNNGLKHISDDIVEEKRTDKEKILSLLDYCYSLQTTSVKIFSYEELGKKFSGRKKLSAYYYKTLPFNFIPTSLVAEYGLVYSGPCGAKSKLLDALLKGQGFQSKRVELLSEDHVPRHSIVEVWIDNKWTPLDPTYNLYFLDSAGKFVASHLLKQDTSFFNEKIKEWEVIHDEKYQQEYTYENVKEATVFHYIHSSLKIFGAGKTPESIRSMHQKLIQLFPEKLLHYELGTPFFYDRPSSSLILIFLLISTWTGRYLYKKRRKTLNNV